MQRAAENVIRVHVFDGIVSEQNFVRVQHLIELKRQKHWRDRAGITERYTYNGFLTCGECGEPLYTHTSKYEFYICKTRHTRERRKRALSQLKPCTNKYMLRNKLEARIDTLIGEKLQDSYFLANLLRRHQERLATATSSHPRAVDSAVALQKLDALRDKKDRILDAFFEGVIDRTRRDEALRDVNCEISSYDELLGTSSAESEPQPSVSLDSLLRVIEPFADWEFLSRENRRSLLRQLCPEISVYRYKVNSLTFNTGGLPQSQGRYTNTHTRTVWSLFRARPSRFMLAAAMNPCPCDPTRECHCTRQ